MTWQMLFSVLQHVMHGEKQELGLCMLHCCLTLYMGTFLTNLSVYNPLPDMPILGPSNSAANKDMMSNKCTNGYTVI